MVDRVPNMPLLLTLIVFYLNYDKKVSGGISHYVLER